MKTPMKSTVKLGLLLSLLVLLSPMLKAQQSPQLTPAGEKPLKAETVKIEIEVLGNIARTTLDMTFYNPHNRVLEGELNFPLAQGQSVTRFALDVNGKLREGVAVEKEKARQAFEAVVRQNIDPGILEMTKGNNFKTRIYPIPANGRKRVVIAYEHELKQLASGNLYLLPLAFEYEIKNFSIKATVYSQEKKPVVEKNELQNFSFKNMKSGYMANISYKNYKANKQLGFVLPTDDKKDITIYSKATKKGDADFFYANVFMQKEIQKKVLPKKICILYDVSGSLAKKQKAKEMNLLKYYFEKVYNADIQLVTFSNEIHSSTKTVLKDGQWETLKKQLDNQNYDGATQLGSLDLSQYNCDEFILISDGISNFGKAEIKITDTPVMVISSLQSADFSYLKYIALQTGGKYINLKNKTEKEALEMLTTQNYQFLKAEYSPLLVKEIYPNMPQSFDKNFSISGQLIAKKAKIILHFGFPGKTMQKITVLLDKNGKISSTNLAENIWATKKIEALNMMYEKNKTQISQLGKRYNIITKNTSFIVLDRVEDYVKYEITPPTELLAQYNKIINTKEATENQDFKEHLNTVATDFEQRVNWYNKNFPEDKPPVAKVRTDSTRIVERGSSTTSRREERRRRVSISRREEHNKSAETNASPLVLNDEFSGANEVEEEVAEVVVSSSPEVEKTKDNKGKRKASIQLAAWNPDMPYLKTLEKTEANKRFEKYIELKNNTEKPHRFS